MGDLGFCFWNSMDSTHIAKWEDKRVWFFGPKKEREFGFIATKMKKEFGFINRFCSTKNKNKKPTFLFFFGDKTDFALVSFYFDQ